MTKILDNINKKEDEEKDLEKMILDDLRRNLGDKKMNRSLEASLFYVLSDCFGFPVRNVATEIVKIGTFNARIFAWAENDNVEMEIIVKRKGH